jgi:putative flippase GtrA
MAIDPALPQWRWQRFARIGRLVAVGGAATACYLLLSLGFHGLLGLQPPLASLLAHALAGFVSYFGHRLFTFRVSGSHSGVPARFVALNAASYAVAYVTPWLAGTYLGLPGVFSLVATAVVLPVANALLMAHVVFRAPLRDADA